MPKFECVYVFKAVGKVIVEAENKAEALKKAEDLTREEIIAAIRRSDMDVVSVTPV